MATEDEPQPGVPTQRCFMDISIGGKRPERVVFELYDDITPRTCKNFRALCTGKMGTGKTGKPLHYKGSTFHRVIRKFMIQGGDFTNHNGSGGESIYGERFEDENFVKKHDRPFLLSMANAGPGTNGSQFFITTVETPHLDNKHVVFGEVVSGKSLIRKIEMAKTVANDKPVEPVLIENCGELTGHETDPPAAKDLTGDKYEDFPDDQAPDGLSGPETYRIASEIKDYGNKAFKAGDLDLGVEKYQKAIRYINEYTVTSDDDPKELQDQLQSLRFTLLTNSALLQNKQGNFRDAEENAAKALAVEELKEVDKVKAYFNRGVALKALKDDTAALENLEKAHSLAPGDAAVLRELEATKKKVAEHQAKKKAKLRDFFGGASS